ncbi:hypothetical protein ACFOVU_28380 [Nocardiopsis sediminis]|uniref:Carbon monoxide dehydrogenase n=1 Tax=Nocardiopsis sediminis TaxID=1778267 RepID=A0ABV8FUL3_9ACTN
MGIPVRHDFLLAVPVEEAWRMVRDLPRIAPHLPGATLDSVDGECADGRLRVRLRGLTVTYRGRLLILSADRGDGEFVVEAEAREARGDGRASATIAGRLSDEGGSTRVTIDADVSVTGRGALVEPAVLAAAGERLLARFGTSLAAEATQPAADRVDGAAPPPEVRGADASPPPEEPPVVAVPRQAPEPDPLSPQPVPSARRVLPSPLRVLAAAGAGLAALIAVREVYRLRRAATVPAPGRPRPGRGALR